MATRKEQGMRSALFLVLCAAAVLLTGCSDDCEICPVCPEPKPCSNELYDGRLYVTMLFGTMGLFVIDTKTEEVIDSIIYPSSGMAVDVTADGKYLAVSNDQATTRIYDARTLDLIAARHMVGGCQFVNHDQWVMTHRLTTDFYSVPDLELVHRDTIDLGPTRRFSETRNSVFTVLDYLLLYEYNLDSFQVVRQWRPDDKDGMPYWMMRFDMSADDSLLYLIAGTPRGVAYVTYDLVSDSVLGEHPTYAQFGHVCANPVTGDVYVTDPGIIIPRFTPGTIYVFDGQTGKYLQGISLYGYLGEESWEALSAWYMQVSPNGSQLYVCTGHPGRGESGAVLRIDTKTRRVESILFPGFGRWPHWMAIGPEP